MNSIPTVAATQSDGPVNLRVVCCYCPAIIAEGDPGATVSHGVCDSCFDRLTNHQADVEAVAEATRSREEAFA